MFHVEHLRAFAPVSGGRRCLPVPARVSPFHVPVTGSPWPKPHAPGKSTRACTHSCSLCNDDHPNHGKRVGVDISPGAVPRTLPSATGLPLCRARLAEP